MSNSLRQTLVIAALSVTTGAAVLALARRQRLSFRYTLGWLSLAGVGVAASLLIPAVEPAASAIGVTPGVIVSAIAVVSLVGICIQLSISISGLQEQVRVLAEELAIHRSVGEVADAD